MISIKQLKPFLWENERDFGDGFTLIELMVVIAIVGLLASIGIPVYSNSIEKAKITKAIGDIYVLEKEIIAYASSNDRYPGSLTDINRGKLKDPWGNSYRYTNIEAVKGLGKLRKDRFLVPLNSDFDLYSAGKDGKTQAPLTAAASHDDIIRASNGDYVGIASAY